MPLKDKEARRVYQRKYNAEKLRSDPAAKALHLQYVKTNNAKARCLIEDELAKFRANGCSFCPETESVCLDAHHLNPKEKEFCIGDALRMRYALIRVQTELKKCICVCRNCHAKIHAGLRPDKNSIIDL